MSCYILYHKFQSEFTKTKSQDRSPFPCLPPSLWLALLPSSHTSQYVFLFFLNNIFLICTVLSFISGRYQHILEKVSFRSNWSTAQCSMLNNLSDEILIPYSDCSETLKMVVGDYWKGTIPMELHSQFEWGVEKLWMICKYKKWRMSLNET